MDLTVRPLTHPPAELFFQAVGDAKIARGAAPTPLSAAAPWMAVAAACSFRLHLRHVALDPATLPFVDILVRLGVRVREEVLSQPPGPWHGALDLRPSSLRGITVPPLLLARIVPELPLLAVLGALAPGETILREPSLASPENQALCHRLAENLRALGNTAAALSDGLVIRGGKPFSGARLASDGHPSLAIAMMVAGLAASGVSVVTDVDAALAAQAAFFHGDFAPHFQPAADPAPPADPNSATDTTCCAGAARNPPRESDARCLPC